jgi:hypothetical protein
MSALGHKQTSAHCRSMSALLPKADIRQHDQDVRFVPEADALLGRTKDKYGQGVRGPSATMSIFQLDRQMFKRAHEPLTRGRGAAERGNIAKLPELLRKPPES